FWRAVTRSSARWGIGAIPRWRKRPSAAAPKSNRPDRLRRRPHHARSNGRTIAAKPPGLFSEPDAGKTDGFKTNHRRQREVQGIRARSEQLVQEGPARFS